MATRTEHRLNSNNPLDPNKNLCGLAIAEFFNVHNEVEYLHVIDDVVRAIRIKYKIKSCLQYVGKYSTMGRVRQKIKKMRKGNWFLIRVSGHVLLADKWGDTVIDTDKRKKDRRKITHIFRIY